MLNRSHPVSLLIRRLFLLFLLLTVCRIVFYIFNYTSFSLIPFKGIVSAFIIGLRFDITSMTILLLPFIIGHSVPYSIYRKRFYRLALKGIFLFVSFIMILLNLIDTGFFQFSGRRSTVDAFKIMSFGNDFTNTLPEMIKDYWYLLVFLCLFIFLLARYYPRDIIIDNLSIRKQYYPTLLILPFIIIAFRGGLQFKPINILTAAGYGNEKAALILNTPFTIIKTYGKPVLEPYTLINQEDADSIYSLYIPADTGGFRKLNVFIIILESFGKEYVGHLNNGDGYTPFLDSLSAHCLYFEKAFANGKRSIDGIPAIVGGIPALSAQPFITSPFAANRINTIPSLLHAKGYNATFFHGGTNGTMGFDNFSLLAGYDKYFGRREFNNDKYFDGSWGIFDEPFLQRVCEETSKQSQPFCNTVFTISSHHPFIVPADIKNNFPAGQLPIHRSIAYADYALKKFFEKAATQPWYNNTLFVITADHTNQSNNNYYNSRAGMYAIPIMYYRPCEDIKGKSLQITQQADILPTVLDYINFDESYYSFGRSALNNSSSGFAMNFINDTYQFIADDKSLIFDYSGKFVQYDLKNDSLQQNSITDSTKIDIHLKRKAEAIVRNFNNSLLQNKMTVSQ